jgi:RimJ/RimL family protein N-acetyltransferase
VGSEAVKQLLNYAFDFLHLRMVYAIISVNNHACSHIYEQLGFAPSSSLKDWTLEGDAILWQKQGK